ncbi:MAG TPA: AAA family ATPase [Candidatus Acidoferrales bacterium]|nr:AAA family ATPase [Candidatus Acidoferrales bacterium]
MPASTFTFDDLIAWSEKLLSWQRDALRRVLNGRLTEADIADLAGMAKSEYGISTPGRPSPVPATTAHVRSSGASTPPVALLAVRDIANVNALASGPVTFAPEGLTVIYGDNASGKSGIARVLKKAGRAREPGGVIRPSVFDPDPGKPASAVIDFRVGAADRSASWVDGSPADAELTKINVFDASCAAVQVEEDNKLAYTPQILQIFQDLAETCRAVAAHLKAQGEALEKTRSPQLDQLSLRPDTKAGILAANLSPQATHKEIDVLCDITGEERARHQTLIRALQDNPTSQADLLDARARRLKDLDALTRSLEGSLSDTALQEFEDLLADATATEEAAEAASLSFGSGSALAGLGSDAWKKLWESARRYSETLGYPGESFPVTRAAAVCLLCQQPIDKKAAERLTKFEQFVQDDVQQRAGKARDKVQARKLQIEAIKIDLSGTQQREAALRGTPQGQSLKAFIVNAKIRRRYLLRKSNNQIANRPGNLPPRPDFTSIRTSLAEEIASLRAAALASERQKMQTEFAELDDRLKLAPLKDILKNEVARLIYGGILELARTDCDTTWITRKGGEVAQTIVTARLRSDFARTLNRLGFAAAPVEIKLGVGTVGHHPYRLSLIAREDVPPSEVLSEGEKTCVALAGFLAELETTNNGSGIVLDDPVSSLDHHYRLRVARLLVDAAKQRQVVVFTHDIVFLLMLTKYARIASIPVTERSLRRGSPRHGLLEEGPPWVAMSVARRIGLLRNEPQNAGAVLRKGDRAGYEQKAEWIYDRLRQSWERAVEELLLNQVVVRFGDGVSTQRLKLLTDITDADVQTVESEMAYCSSFVHDESGAVNAGIPDPVVVEADIKRLDDWVASLRKRGRK